MIVKPAGAVADTLESDAELIEQSQMQVRKRCVLGISNVAPAREVTGASAGQQQWNVAWIM